MSVYRTVQVNFWTDTKVSDDFSPEDRYFYLYLLTNPATNLCGCYQISTKIVSNQTGYNIDTVNNLIVRFQNYHKLVSYDQQTKEILILNWHKFNWTASPKFIMALDKEISSVKSEVFKNYLISVKNGEDTVSIPYAYGIDTSVSVYVTDTVTVNDTVEKKQKKDKKHSYGEYRNVMLTDYDLDTLKSEFSDWEERINRLSSYMASSGKSYKNHLATIRNWARREATHGSCNGSTRTLDADELDAIRGI